MAKIAVILSGCGVYDGSEIHEATLGLYALSKYGFEYQCFAPDINQYHVINHLTGEVSSDKRNVLIEAARIARGNIKPLREFSSDDFDGLLMPGGFGAAKNLSTYAFDGENCKVHNDLVLVLKAMHSAQKPIVALCIAPVIVAKVLGAAVTIGNDSKTAKHIEALGGSHKSCNYNEAFVDWKNKVITTPCYMLASNVYETGVGIEAAIVELKKMILP